MTSVRTRTTTITTVTDDSSNEFEVQSTPIDWADALVSVVGSKALVSYLTVDHYPYNLLTEWDGDGSILHANDSSDRAKMYVAMGMDKYGEPNLDLVDHADVRDAYIAHFVANMTA